MGISRKLQKVLISWMEARGEQIERTKTWGRLLERLIKDRDIKKEFVKNKWGLVDLLFIDRDLDIELPSPQDINQGGKVFSLYCDIQFGSCAWLATLMGMAKNNPKSIFNLFNMEKPSFEKVDVLLYNVEYKHEIHCKPEKDVYDLIATIKPTKAKYIPVTIDDIIKLYSRTHHRRLWPLAVEIAVAKYLRKLPNMPESLGLEEAELKSAEENIWYSYRKELKNYYLRTVGKKDPNCDKMCKYLETGIKPKGDDLIEQEKLIETYKNIKKSFEESRGEIKEDLEDFVEDEFDKQTNDKFVATVLTGKASRIRYPLNFKNFEEYQRTVQEGEKFFDDYWEYIGNYEQKEIGKFTSRKGEKDTYELREINLFNRIRKKLDDKQIVTVGFSGLILKGNSKHPQDEDVINDTIQDFINIKSKSKSFNQLNAMATDRMTKIKQTETQTPGKHGKRKKRGITSGHAYLVVDAFSLTTEGKTFYFVAIENPHDETTYVDYTKDSKRYSPTARRLTQNGGLLDKAKKDLLNKLADDTLDDLYLNNHRTCIMELNHFSKLLLSINYTRDPKS